MNQQANNIEKKYPPRIEQRIIDNQYISYPFHTLVKDSIIPFDCYIKRYNDFVIIIEAGTLMSTELLHKLDKNQEIYILKKDSEKMDQFQIDHGIILLSESDAAQTSEKKLTLLYTAVSNAMQAIFDKGNEKFSLDPLRLPLNELANVINLNSDLFPILLKIIPNEYTTHHHSTNVAFFAMILAKALDLSQEDIVDVGLTGLLHDIGKLRIDHQLLLKPSRLEEDEYETIKHHSDYGYSILKDNGVENQKILNGVHFHHERLDGSGYPKGLHERLIPKYAKIIGICDAFDALTTKRTFRNHYTSYEALLVMKQEMASQFDTFYINTLVKLLRPH